MGWYKFVYSYNFRLWKLIFCFVCLYLEEEDEAGGEFHKVIYDSEFVILCLLGKGPTTKSDEFLEKFQTAFDHPSFSENYVANFL